MQQIKKLPKPRFHISPGTWKFFWFFHKHKSEIIDIDIQKNYDIIYRKCEYLQSILIRKKK